MRLCVAWIGKTKLDSTSSLTNLYLRRIRQWSTIEGLELAGKEPERALLKRAADARFWLCDPRGKTFTSEAFAAFLEREFNSNSKEMIFAIGGPDGFSPDVVNAAQGRLALSTFTLSHELARVVVLEQLYRAAAILNHHPYPH